MLSCNSSADSVSIRGKLATHANKRVDVCVYSCSFYDLYYFPLEGLKADFNSFAASLNICGKLATRAIKSL